MDTQIHLNSTPVGDIALTAAEKAAMGQFEGTLNFCVGNWYENKTAVVLAGNIQERFGTALVQYFQHTLVGCVGSPVTLTLVNNNDGPTTVVHMPKRDGLQPFGQVQPNIDPLTETSEQDAVKPSVTVAPVKKAPRPMNCWIIFRDVMHKRLKLEHPELSVQEISTKCSEIWRNLTPGQKKPWQAAAQSAKEEHMRLHPDYKYSPRKPGEKKKRQSRKAKLAAAATAKTEMFDLASATDVPMVTFDNNISFEAAFGMDFTNTIDITANEFAQLSESTSFLNPEQDGVAADGQLHESESIRHDRLQTEVAAELAVNDPFQLFGDEAFAFRAGADGNATLPSIFSDGF